MSYSALYRKFRPQTFDEVKGQNHIVTTLKNQIRNQRLGHAYLFCGTRGTGKTTVAKILAKAVNCEHPIDGEPCGECETCKSITEGSSLNVIEIDAASNNGVDNIREIKEQVQYSPATGKYKVYIIDEVHMLSIGAFNALLKTLEEPPKYVIFILATTEVHKIPITILSRCQRYDFHRITSNVIKNQLIDLTNQEKVEAEDKALEYIARMADGSMRDALSLLDQCIAFNLGKKLTYDATLDVLGTVDIQVYSELLDFIMAQNVAKVMDLIEDVASQGREWSQFITDFLWFLRNLLLVGQGTDAEEALEVSTEQMKFLQEKAKLVDEKLLIRDIRILSALLEKLRFATTKRVLVEVELIKLCRPEIEMKNTDLAEKVKSLEEQLNLVMLQLKKKEKTKEEKNTKKLPEQKSGQEEQIRKSIERLPKMIRYCLKRTELKFNEKEKATTFTFPEDCILEKQYVIDHKELIEKSVHTQIIV